ncbi:unnamed protein product [Ectocarpus fasciculatus]
MNALSHALTGLSSLALAACILAALRKIIQIALRERFPVHRRGAVVITGASSGIGRHAAEHLAARGYTVFAGVRKVRDAAAIKASGTRGMHALLIDVNSRESITKAVATLSIELQHLDMPLVGLVNNAGVGESFAAELHPEDNARGMFETNFWGAVTLTREALPLLRAGRGRIIMISSVAALISQPMTSMYCASKRALEGFTDSLRQEVRHFNISVSMLEPAYVQTDLLSKVQALKSTSDMTQQELDTKAKADMLYPQFFSAQHREKKVRTMKSGDSPQVTSDAILDALASPYPKTRYVVASVNGTPAWVVAWIFWAVPDRLKDFLVNNI